MPNKVARVLYLSRSAFVLYSRTSSSSEIVVAMRIFVCDILTNVRIRIVTAHQLMAF